MSFMYISSEFSLHVYYELCNKQPIFQKAMFHPLQIAICGNNKICHIWQELKIYSKWQHNIQLTLLSFVLPKILDYTGRS